MEDGEERFVTVMRLGSWSWGREEGLVGLRASRMVDWGCGVESGLVVVVGREGSRFRMMWERILGTANLIWLIARLGLRTAGRTNPGVSC